MNPIGADVMATGTIVRSAGRGAVGAGGRGSRGRTVCGDPLSSCVCRMCRWRERDAHSPWLVLWFAEYCRGVLRGPAEVGVDVVHDDGDGVGQQRPGPRCRLLKAGSSLAHPFLEAVVGARDHHDPAVGSFQPRSEVVIASVESTRFGEAERPAQPLQRGEGIFVREVRHHPLPFASNHARDDTTADASVAVPSRR